eukprot:10039067-Alexandrium_andersonii.AAC.2
MAGDKGTQHNGTTLPELLSLGSEKKRASNARPGCVTTTTIRNLSGAHRPFEKRSVFRYRAAYFFLK